jgi:ATP-dependent DNA helicase RecG
MEMDTSIPRNPVLAKLFRTVHLAENAGFGFDKMIDRWYLYNTTKPVFYSDFTSTITTFKFSVKDVVKDKNAEVIKLITQNKTKQ